PRAVRTPWDGWARNRAHSASIRGDGHPGPSVFAAGSATAVEIGPAASLAGSTDATEGVPMRRVLSGVVACIACTATAPYTPATPPPAPSRAPAPSMAHVTGPARSADALAAFDGLPNGLVDLPTHRADQAAFDRQEEIISGLGPLYNAHSCRDCHENPVAGGAGQMTELRAGHRDAQGTFVFPQIRIGGGSVVVTGRTLIHDKAIS